MIDSSEISLVTAFVLPISFISSEITCGWQGRILIHGNSSCTIFQHFCIVEHVSVTIRTTFVHPYEYISSIIRAAQYSADLVLLDVSTERQKHPPSFAVMNAEFMRGRSSHESQPSETYS